MDRREFLTVAGGALLWPAAHAWAAHHEESESAGGRLEKALVESDLVYVSPLKEDGNESTCHGEVWYGYFDGSVVLITGFQTWKARAIAKGWDRARIWVGNYGRWNRLIGKNESFRKGPSFEAQAKVVKDDALLDVLLADFERKYPSEIANWRDKMRNGYHDGSRVLIRYSPIESPVV